MAEEPEYSELFYDSPCFDCKYYDFWGEHGVFTMKCKAFPEGIPFEIWTHEVNHTSPYTGDNNIQYEKLDENLEREYNQNKRECEQSSKEGLLWLKKWANK